jgi:hypothetical protein
VPLPVSASEWQPPRRLLPAAAIVGLEGPEMGGGVQRLLLLAYIRGGDLYCTVVVMSPDSNAEVPGSTLTEAEH